MKLINSYSPVFTNVSINPAFHILGDDRRAYRSRFVVYIYPTRFRQTTRLAYIPPRSVHFPQYTSTTRQWISAGRMFFVFKNRIAERTTQSARLVIDIVLYISLWQQPIHSMARQTVATWQRVRRQLSTFKTYQWLPWAGCANGFYFKNYPRSLTELFISLDAYIAQ
jgi:hypothetical protein